jgi:hypothetical protein
LLLCQHRGLNEGHLDRCRVDSARCTHGDPEVLALLDFRSQIGAGPATPIVIFAEEVSCQGLHPQERIHNLGGGLDVKDAYSLAGVIQLPKKNLLRGAIEWIGAQVNSNYFANPMRRVLSETTCNQDQER